MAIENIPSENPKTGRITALSVDRGAAQADFAAAGRNLSLPPLR
jgi:hypothetical protein